MAVHDLHQLWNRRVPSKTPNDSGSNNFTVSGQPFQYLVGCCFWRDLVLVVNEHVLIPRPETELLIDFATEAMRKFRRTLMMKMNDTELGKRGREEEINLIQRPWADIGTGSGCLAIALKNAIEDVQQMSESDANANLKWNQTKKENPLVYAVDISEDALNVARHNIERCRRDLFNETRSDGNDTEELSVPSPESLDNTVNGNCTNTNTGRCARIRLLCGNLLDPILKERKDMRLRIINEENASSEDTMRSTDNSIHGCDELLFAGIVSNPPYIPPTQIPSLQVSSCRRVQTALLFNMYDYYTYIYFR